MPDHLGLQDLLGQSSQRPAGAGQSSSLLLGLAHQFLRQTLLTRTIPARRAASEVPAFTSVSCSCADAIESHHGIDHVGHVLLLTASTHARRVESDSVTRFPQSPARRSAGQLLRVQIYRLHADALVDGRNAGRGREEADVRTTIAGRLILLGAVGLVAMSTVAAVAALGSTRQTDESARMQQVSVALSEHWNTDMLHDGMRADVMSAMYATSDEQRETYEVDGVSEHAAELVTHFDAATANAPGALRSTYEGIRPQLVEYADSAKAMVTQAGTDKAAARAELPAFLTIFGQLEDQLGAAKDELVKAVAESQRLSAATGTSTRRVVMLVSLAAATIFFTLSLWVLRATTRPLRRMVEALHAVANRDLTVHVDADSNDEIGAMATALDTALASIREAITVLADSSTSLVGAASTLTSISSQVGQAAEQTATQTEQVSVVARDVAGSVGSMSTATEEMTASIGEIAGQSTRASDVARAAVGAAEETSSAVRDLDQASAEIGEIVKVITVIAQQTNLLALNATIEAARAGDAGKGFAVVASEVKDLAQETSRATDDITAKIAAIQSTTGRASESINQITLIISQINENQITIASAVEEQTATTTEISRSVGEISSGSATMADTIGIISSSAANTSVGAASARQSAEELSALANRFRELVGQFTY
jgi:methyl-accepting chemotaxis protein